MKICDDSSVTLVGFPLFEFCMTSSLENQGSLSFFDSINSNICLFYLFYVLEVRNRKQAV